MSVTGEPKTTTLKRVDEKAPHGLYLYEPRHSAWRLIATEGEAFKPAERGVYVLYFDNAKCSACRKYDNVWFPFVEKWYGEGRGHNTRFVIVFCDWFARECKSQAAAETFRKFDVHASPTTVVLYADSDGSVRYQEKYEGVLYEFELSLVLKEFEDRALKAMRGEKVSPPISKGSSSKAIEELVTQILKALLLGEKKEQG